MVLFTLNYSRYMTATQAKERKKFDEEMKAQSNFGATAESGQHRSIGKSGGERDVPSGEALLASEGVSLN
jgi:hypothetical protein